MRCPICADYLEASGGKTYTHLGSIRCPLSLMKRRDLVWNQYHFIIDAFKDHRKKFLMGQFEHFLNGLI